LLGCFGVTAAQLITLQGAVHAVGGHVPWAELLVALLGSAAARSAVPSPGGVGPVEAALVGGLTALGLGWGAAATAVAVYRTAGHVLPVLAGVLSIRELRRRALL
ncbi:MAG: TIGR00374 family protein, partial [Mycobacteriales bacterium]